MVGMKQKVVLDTNVLVAAGFNRSSSSTKILQAIEDGQLEMLWNDGTRRFQNQQTGRCIRDGNDGFFTWTCDASTNQSWYRQ